jgi:hypothetical protein
MNQKTKEILSKKGLKDKPVYTVEDLKELAKHLEAVKKKNDKAFNIYKQLQVFDYNPFLFKAWAEQANEDYDYKAIFFESSIDRLPLIINDELDGIEDIVLQWRFERSK